MILPDYGVKKIAFGPFFGPKSGLGVIDTPYVSIVTSKMH